MSIEKPVRLILLPVGALMIGSTYLLAPVAALSAGAADFLRGFGLSVIIFALLFQAKWKRQP